MMPSKTRKAILLTGGVGSGKSRILGALKEEYGAAVLQTDMVAKELEEPGQPGHEALVKAFGKGILDGNGRLYKPELVRLVFADDKTRDQINSLIHPLVWDKVEQWIQHTDAPLLVVESALMPEKPHDLFQSVWYVSTDRDNRIQRLMEKRGYSRERCQDMIAGQPPEETYRQHADVLIDNNGTSEELNSLIQAAVEHLKGSG